MLLMFDKREKCTCGKPVLGLGLCQHHYREAFRIELPKVDKPSPKGFLAAYKAKHGILRRPAAAAVA